MTDYIKEYHNLIDSKPKQFSKKMILQRNRIEKILKKDYVVLNLKKANKPILFIENECRHFQGTYAGNPFKLELWQKYIISCIFGIVDKNTNKRICRDAFILVGRKNGKTALMAALSLYGLLVDNESSPQIYALATKKEQARILFESSYNMVSQSPTLRKYVKKKRAEIEEIPRGKRKNQIGGVFKALASDSNSLDGLNAHFGIFDELHAYKDTNLIDVIQSSQGAREQPLLLFISTNGVIRDSVFDKRYQYYKNILEGKVNDDSVMPFIYELDDIKEANIPNMWIKANPNLGVSISKDYIARQVKIAKDDPVQKIGILTRNFNIPQNPVDLFLTNDECKLNQFDESKIMGTQGFYSLDMAWTTDLACLTYLTPDPNNREELYTKRWFFKPKNLVQEHAKIDGVDYPYFVKKGELITFDGDNINQAEVLEFMSQKAKTLKLKILKVGVDPYRCDYIISQLRQRNYDEYVVAISNQYKKAITPTIWRMKSLLKRKKIYFNEELMQVHLASTSIEIDRREEVNLIKYTTRGRIDGAMSLLYAIKTYELYLLDRGITITQNYEEV